MIGEFERLMLGVKTTARKVIFVIDASVKASNLKYLGTCFVAVLNAFVPAVAAELSPFDANVDRLLKPFVAAVAAELKPFEAIVERLLAALVLPVDAVLSPFFAHVEKLFKLFCALV